ncbi:MAG: endonuclease/exonuclease/phosphatase family protein, partial [Bacteroidales bacterium]
LLYNKEVASLIVSRAIYPVSVKGDTLPVGRPVLYAKVKVDDRSLHLLLNHWPSRRGGVMAASAMRRGLTDYIIAFTDSIFKADGEESSVIIAGDLNCTPSDDEIKSFGAAGFVNLLSADGNVKRSEGTYKYRGVWQILDHIIVSKSMTEGISDFIVEESMIHSAEFLLIDDDVYPGRKPFATFDGYRYAGGYSDHLPVRLVVRRLR